MHPILLIVLALPILLGLWMLFRGLQSATPQQRLGILKWIMIVLLFGLSAYLAWTGLWRQALGVLGSLLLFLWNWRGLIAWLARRQMERRGGKVRDSDSSPNMRPARQPGQVYDEVASVEMSRKDAMAILDLKPGYSEIDINAAWEAKLRTQTPQHGEQEANEASPHNQQDAADTAAINAIHQARAILLKDIT